MSFSNLAFFVLLTKYQVVCPACEESCVEACGIMPQNIAAAAYQVNVVNLAINNCGKSFCAPCRDRIRRVKNGMRHVTDPDSGYQLFERVSGKQYIEPEVTSCTCRNCPECANFAAWMMFHQIEWVENA